MRESRPLVMESFLMDVDGVLMVPSVDGVSGESFSEAYG